LQINSPNNSEIKITLHHAIWADNQDILTTETEEICLEEGGPDLGPTPGKDIAEIEIDKAEDTMTDMTAEIVVIVVIGETEAEEEAEAAEAAEMEEMAEKEVDKWEKEIGLVQSVKMWIFHIEIIVTDVISKKMKDAKLRRRMMPEIWVEKKEVRSLRENGLVLSAITWTTSLEIPAINVTSQNNKMMN
jgi:hypothetical protein